MLLERLEKALDDAETVPPDDVVELEDIPDEDNSAPDAGDPVDLDLRNPPTSSLDTPNIDDSSHTLFSPEYTGTTSNMFVETVKNDDEFEVQRSALVAAIEADLEKRKARADRFGIAWELSAFDIERLECAKRGLPFPRTKAADSDGKKLGSPQKQLGKSLADAENGGRASRFGVNVRGKRAKKADVCRNCGKRGHWAKDCWAPGAGAGGPGNQKRTSQDITMQNQHQKEKRKPDVTIDADDKKRSRSDRFGFGMEGLAKDPDFKAKLAARAARFAEN